MSSKQTASRNKKISLTRELIAIATDSLFQEKNCWDRIHAKKYAKSVLSLEALLRIVNPNFTVRIERGVIPKQSNPHDIDFSKDANYTRK